MKMCRLGDVANVQSGFAFKSAEFKREGVKLLRNTNILPQRIYWDDLACLDPVQCNRYSAYQLRPGDLLLSLDRPIISTGIKVARVGENDVPSFLVQRVGRFRLDESRIDPEYLYAYLRSPGFAAEISGHEQSLGVPHVSPGQVEAVVMPLPELTEQRRVAARLKAQLAEVETARQAAQAQLREVALLRNRLLKASFVGLDAAPRKRLGDYAHITSGVTPSRDNDAYWKPAEIAWVKTGEIDFAPITEVRESISRKALVECSLSLLPPKTVLIAITGEGKTRGRSAVLEVSATTNQHSVAILPNDTWDASFLQLWLQSSYHELRELSEGRGGSRSALSGAQIKALETPVPGINEQRHIVARLKSQLDETDNMAQSVTAQLAEIERLPQRLLSQAFNNVEAKP
jgi:type I restriction enzyme S subunit